MLRKNAGRSSSHVRLDFIPASESAAVTDHANLVTMTVLINVELAKVEEATPIDLQIEDLLGSWSRSWILVRYN